MNLVLVRHAEAVERGTLRRDAARPLTPAGRRRFARSVEGLRRLGLRFDLVLHSPWLRAVETADLLAPIVRGEFAVTRSLSKRPSDALLAELQSAGAAHGADSPADRTVAVVGHEPWLSELASRLVTGSADHAARFALRKGGVIVLTGAPEAGAMTVAAAYPPKTLRRLAR